MTQFAAVKDKRDAAGDAPIEPAPEPAEKGADKSVAMPGLATGPAKKGTLEFESTGFEKVSWSWADASGAVKEYARCLGLIDTLRTRVKGLNLKPNDRTALSDAINDIEKKLTVLTEKKVTVADRQNAIKTVKDAAATIAAIDVQATEDVKAKITEDAKIQLAEEEKKKKEDAAKAEAEAKRKKDEEAAKKAEEEKKAKEAAAKAEDDAKRKKDEEAARKKKEKEDAAAAKKAKEEEDARLAAEGAATKKREAEEAAQRRLSAYGDKATAHGAAQGAAEDNAHAQYEAEIAAAAPPKKTGKSRKSGGVSSEVEEAAKTRKTELKARIEDNLAAVATSASGQKLGDAELTWVMSASKGDGEYAQRLANLADGAGIDAAKTVAKEADAKTIAVKCLDLFRGGTDPKLVVRTARAMVTGPGPFATWLGTVATANLADVLDLAEKFDTARPMVAAVVPALGAGMDTEEFLTEMRAAKAKLTDVTWLMGLAGQPGFGALVRVVKRFPLNPAKVRAIHTAAAANFDLDDIAKVCTSLPKSLDAVPAILLKADPHAVSFVKLWLDVGSGADPEPLVQDAVRAEALLADAPKCAQLTITVEQNDEPYGRGHNNAYRVANTANNARTGFLLLNFPNHPVGHLHTHWNEATVDIGKIRSMHVQSAVGDNGIELNKWYKFFPKLTAAAVAAHNVHKTVAGTTLSLL